MGEKHRGVDGPFNNRAWPLTTYGSELVLTLHHLGPDPESGEDVWEGDISAVGVHDELSDIQIHRDDRYISFTRPLKNVRGINQYWSGTLIKEDGSWKLVGIFRQDGDATGPHWWGSASLDGF